MVDYRSLCSVIRLFWLVSMLRENLMVATISVPRSSFHTKALDVICTLLGKAACGIIIIALGVIEGNLS